MNLKVLHVFLFLEHHRKKKIYATWGFFKKAGQRFSSVLTLATTLAVALLNLKAEQRQSFLLLFTLIYSYFYI